MPRPAIDFTGQTKGFLKVLRRIGTQGTAPLWEVHCECGTKAKMTSSQLLGATVSCGCYRLSGDHKRRHGHAAKAAKSRVYRCWDSMKQRCYNPNNIRFDQYGGRGIQVCDRWLNSFENFYADMGEQPSRKHSIDRIDNDGNYTPSNCRWATDQQQKATHGITKLDESDIRRIRAQPDKKLRELAKEFNVTEANISQIRSGKTWKHVV